MPDSNAITRLSKAVQMLSEARNLDEIMRLREMAQVAEQYAKAEKLGDEAVQYAQEIRIRSARKAGQVLMDMKDNGQRRSAQANLRRGPEVPAGDFGKRLQDLGVSPRQSSRWQKIAAVPDDEFEKRIARGWGETSIAEGGVRPRSGPQPTPTKKAKPTLVKAPGPKTKVNGYTHKQSLLGLQNVAVQVEGLAEALDGGLVGDWSRLYGDEAARVHFEALEEYTPVLLSKLRRAIRDWKKGAAA
jgi:hypothetical protein